MKNIIEKVNKYFRKEAQKGSVNEAVTCNYCDDYYGDRTCHIHREQE